MQKAETETGTAVEEDPGQPQGRLEQMWLFRVWILRQPRLFAVTANS